MAELEWDLDRGYEEGVDRGVLYTDGIGVAWSGLTSINENVAGGDLSSYYYDGTKIIDRTNGEDFAFTIEAITYPDEFSPFDGVRIVLAGQDRPTFGFSYRTKHSFGHKIHLVYNAIAAPSTKTRKTTSDAIDISPFSWDASTTPTKVPGAKPTAHLMVDTYLANPEPLDILQNLLYGTDLTDPELPTAEDVVDLFDAYAVLVVIDNGDGTWTATGPDEAIQMPDETTLQITWPSAIYIDSESYHLSSL